jgi:hypothetical protein
VDVGGQVLYQALLFTTGILLQSGLREPAEAAIGQLTALADRTKRPEIEVVALHVAALIAPADGRLEDVLAVDEHMRQRAEESGLAEFGLLHRLLATNRAHLYLGRAEPLELAFPLLELFSSDVGQSPREGTLTALLGQLRSSPLGTSPADGVPVQRCASVVELATLTRDESLGRTVYRYLKTAPLVTFGWLPGPVPVARLLGDLASLLGEREQARAYYEQAFEVCERMRLRPERALTALGLAELLLAGDEAEQAEAQPHLDFSIAEFQEMKMQPSLERALAHKELLKA